MPSNASGSHSWTGHYNTNLAWSEGWATLVSCAIADYDGDQNPDHFTSIGNNNFDFNVEHAPGGGEWDGDGNGDDTESAICGLLWDTYDSHNDNLDTLSDGFSNIFDTVRYYTTNNHHIYNIYEFWDGWFSRNHGDLEKLNSIFWNHGIDQNEAPVCTLTAPNNGAWYQGTTIVSATTSDVDGTILWVDFQYSLNYVSWDDIGTDYSSAGGWSYNWNTSSTNDFWHKRSVQCNSRVREETILSPYGSTYNLMNINTDFQIVAILAMTLFHE